jgi:hypothetical protein
VSSPPESSARVLHGFDGVEYQVHEHLLQWHTVRYDFGQFGGKVLTPGSVMRPPLAELKEAAVETPSFGAEHLVRNGA